MNRKLLIPALVLAAVAGVGASSFFKRDTALTASGTLEARNISVGSKVGGRVTQVLAAEGDRVEKDQLLITFDAAELDAALVQARGRYAQAQANLARLTAGYRPEEIAQAQAVGRSRQQAIQQAEALAERAGADAAHAEADFRRYAIEPYKDRLAGRLSGGWKQRLALGCAMLHNPKIVYLDEPTAGIDPVARRNLWDLLFDMSGQGTTFFVTTHYMDEAERCSHLAYIYYGKLIADGTPDTLREIPDASPPGTGRFEIATRNVTSALRLTRKLGFVHSATVFGRSIHALIDEKITQPELRRELENAGVHVEEIRPLTPDLEDVFVELTRKRQAESEAANV